MQVQNYIPKKLSGFVELISQQHSYEPGNWTFLPDGISCLMFRLNSKSGWKILKAKSIKEEDNPSGNFCFITGFSTAPVLVSYDHFEYLGVFLTPLALQAIFGIPADKLRDAVIEGSYLIPELHMIEDQLQQASSFYERAQLLENWLYSKINESADLHTALSLNRLAEKLSSHPHAFGGKELEDFMGYSRAQTHRIFNRWFGLSSQKYQRFKKFILALEEVHYSDESLTAISYKQGFFDQAHFTRTFREFAHLTPRQYRKYQTDLIAQFPTQ